MSVLKKKRTNTKAATMALNVSRPLYFVVIIEQSEGSKIWNLFHMLALMQSPNHQIAQFTNCITSSGLTM